MSSRSAASSIWLVLLLALATAHQTVGATAKCWRLEQKHKLNGRQILLIGDNKWRLENRDLGYTLIADGPKAVVYAFNKNKNLRCSSSFADFNCSAVRLVRVVSGEELKDLTWKPIPHKGSARHPNSYYQATAERTCFKGSKSGGFLAGAKYSVKVRYTLAVSNEIKLPANVAKVLADFQGTPAFGVPTQEIFEAADRGAPTSNLETVDIKRIADSQSIWTVPGGYKETKQIADVVTSGDTTLFEDFADHAIR